MAGPPSQYSTELWQQARDLVAASMTFPEVAERTGIGLENLYKKAQRENWFVPTTALAEAKAVIAQAQQLKAYNPDQEGRQLSRTVQTGVDIAESIEEMCQKSKISALKGILPVFTKTFTEGSELLSQPVDTWKNAGSMTNILSKLAGWDRPQTAVQLNVWGGSGSTKSAQCWEAQEVDVPNLEDENQ
jgi:hypothetical protein